MYIVYPYSPSFHLQVQKSFHLFYSLFLTHVRAHGYYVALSLLTVMLSAINAHGSHLGPFHLWSPQQTSPKREPFLCPDQLLWFISWFHDVPQQYPLGNFEKKKKGLLFTDSGGLAQRTHREISRSREGRRVDFPLLPNGTTFIR